MSALTLSVARASSYSLELRAAAPLAAYPSIFALCSPRAFLLLTPARVLFRDERISVIVKSNELVRGFLDAPALFQLGRGHNAAGSRIQNSDGRELGCAFAFVIRSADSLSSIALEGRESQLPGEGSCKEFAR